MAAPTTGRFVWYELHTGDRAKAMKFYSQLFGWEGKEVPMGPGEQYGLFLKDGKDFAGATTHQKGAPPRWLVYLAVDDVDAAAAKVPTLGGKVLQPAFDIPNVGRMAVVQDPQGAVFSLYKHGGKPYPDETDKPPVGAFCWNELMTSDPEAAEKFYVGLFGYGTQHHDMGPMGKYHLLTRGERQTAGIMKMPPNVPVPNWLSYVAVAEVDASTRNAKELGAQVLMPPTDIPNIGRFSVISDPTGAVIALFTGK